MRYKLQPLLILRSSSHSLQLVLAMATTLARALPFVPHVAALLLLLLLIAIAPLSIGGATPNVLSSAQHVNAVAHGAAALTIPEVVHGQFGSSDNVLVFQTSFDILEPCFGTSIITPPVGHSPPVRVIIASPTEAGTYPVILFKHGFALANCFYTQLFTSLASAGYIVVGPQAFTLNYNCTEEIEETANVANWISESLAVVLKAAVSDADVVPDMSQLVMAGHSRGGKIAFALALGMASIEVPSFSALATLDPVDGTASDSITYPPIVAAGCNHTRNQISFPVLILGTGYGSDKGILGAPACAPACCSHMAYFNCSSAPIMYELVASDYGHLDFLDDSVSILVTGLCKSGSSRAPLRDFAGELMLAFLQSALEGEADAMDNILENWESANITLEEPQVYTKADSTALGALVLQLKKREPISRTIPQEAAAFF